MLYNINSLKVGLKVLQNNAPCIIIENECIKPGKGQSFNRVRFRQIISGKIIEKTLKSGEFLKSANIVDTRLVYVYTDGVLWYFMNEKSFDQIGISSDVIGDNIKWMQEQLRYLVTFWDGNPILVSPPDLIQLKIIKISSATKRITSPLGNRIATVSTGAMIKVPGFVQSGEFIKINTKFGTYVSRVK